MDPDQNQKDTWSTPIENEYKTGTSDFYLCFLKGLSESTSECECLVVAEIS